jgi:hypothetical protein
LCPHIAVYAAARMSPATTASQDAAPAGGPTARTPRGELVVWGGALLVLLLAGLLFSRFSIDDWLRRDESIYAYGGQQLAHGVAPYVSIFDPKSPLATIFAGAGAAWARAFGGDDVHVMRLIFFAFSCLAVTAVYALGVALWRSAVVAIAAAITFASFRGFALDAIGGPDAKTPGIFLGVAAMALIARRRWFWGAAAGALAALVWQPFVVYPAAAVLGALLVSPSGRRRRPTLLALAGSAIPVVVVLVYFALAGALSQFVEAAIRFPLTGIERGHETLGQRLDFVAGVVTGYYGRTRVLFWAGTALLPLTVLLRLARSRGALRAAVRDPYVSVVFATWVPLIAFSARDFQGYPDLYPLLPYAAIGVGEGVGLVRSLVPGAAGRRASAAIVLAGVAVLAIGTWAWYSVGSPRDTELLRQRATARELQRLSGPRGTLYALGDPTPLVLTHRRNPDRFIYLGSGVARWKVDHTAGGFAGWTREIRAADPAVITLAGWNPNGRWAVAMTRWLRAHYAERQLGRQLVFVPPRTVRRARTLSVALAPPRRPVVD